MKRVAIGIVVKNEKILLIRRLDKEPGLDWCLPGGGIEADEKEEAAVAREILEETGVVCQPVKKLPEMLHPTNPNIMRVYWQCAYVSGQPTITEPDRHEAVEWVDFDKALMLLERDKTPFVCEILAQAA